MRVGRAASFAIVANGFADGPAQALRDYLVERGAWVTTVFHPLTPEQGRRHLVTTYAGGRCVRERTVWLPLRAPLSFALDPFVPLTLPPVDVWIGFNPLACARGLLARRRGKARFVAQWAVDFTPNRFGAGNPATLLYDRLDRLCCTRADARIELSQAARDARNSRHRLTDEATPTYIVPMGAWLDRVPVTPPEGFRRRRVVFLGHLAPRQGAEALLDALALLRSREDTVTADVIGTGPLEARLKERAKALGLGNVVRFHGFVPDHREVERLLAEGSVAVAPYRPDKSTLTAYADPGKLKAYLAAGLPIVLTDVPPNAHELASEAGAELVPFDPRAIADAVLRILESPETWQARRQAALAYARRFDWSLLFGDLLNQLGLDLPPAS
jgi:glycosyltransferase involved in cell wall biosynthesis